MGESPKYFLYSRKANGLFKISDGQILSNTIWQGQLSQILFSKMIQNNSSIVNVGLKGRSKVARPVIGNIGKVFRLAKDKLELIAKEDDEKKVVKLFKIFSAVFDLIVNDTIINSVLLKTIRNTLKSEVHHGSQNTLLQGFGFGMRKKNGTNFMNKNTSSETTKNQESGLGNANKMSVINQAEIRGSNPGLNSETSLRPQEQINGHWKGPSTTSVFNFGEGQGFSTEQNKVTHQRVDNENNKIGLSSTVSPLSSQGNSSTTQGKTHTNDFEKVLSNKTLLNAVLNSLNKSSLLDDTENDEVSLWDIDNSEWDSRRKREANRQKENLDNTRGSPRSGVNQELENMKSGNNKGPENGRGGSSSGFSNKSSDARLELNNERDGRRDGVEKSIGSGINPGSQYANVQQGNNPDIGDGNKIIGNLSMLGIKQGFNSSNNENGKGSARGPVTVNNSEQPKMSNTNKESSIGMNIFTNKFNDGQGLSTTTFNPNEGSQKSLKNNYLQPENVDMPLLSSTTGRIAVDPIHKENRMATNYLQPIDTNLSASILGSGRIAIDPIPQGSTNKASQNNMISPNGVNIALDNHLEMLTKGLSSHTLGLESSNPLKILESNKHQDRSEKMNDLGSKNDSERTVRSSKHPDSKGNFWNDTEEPDHSFDVNNFDALYNKKNSLGVVKLSAVTLQGFLLLTSSHHHVSNLVQEISNCFKQIIWSPDDISTGVLCSRLTRNFKQDLRELLIMVARGELPSSLDKIKLEQLVSILQSGFSSTVFSLGWGVPFTNSDFSALLISISNGLRNMTQSSTVDAGTQSGWKLISTVFSTFISDEITNILVDITAELQGKFLI
jgi:hypothetical protein